MSIKTVNPGARNSKPIFLASQYGHYEVVKLLLTSEKVNSNVNLDLAYRLATNYITIILK